MPTLLLAALGGVVGHTSSFGVCAGPSFINLIDPHWQYMKQCCFHLIIMCRALLSVTMCHHGPEIRAGRITTGDSWPLLKQADGHRQT